MGCAPCERAAAQAASRRTTTTQKEFVPTEGCEITMEQVSIWIEKVRCFQKGGFYSQVPHVSKKQLNIYLSFLLSAQKMPNKPCQFENELQEIESFVTVITALDLCNS